MSAGLRYVHFFVTGLVLEVSSDPIIRNQIHEAWLMGNGGDGFAILERTWANFSAT
jgi:hypothetical protein